MPELASQLLKWTARLGLTIAAITLFLFIVNFATSLIFVTLNQNVLSDIFLLVQQWLPFNLNVVLLWFVTASIAYLMYRLALAAFIWINRFVGES